MSQLFDTQPEAAISGYAHVAPEQGIDASGRGLTYAVPAAMGDLQVGMRVVVPLGRGNRSVPGYVIELSNETDVDPSKLKPIKSRDPHGVRLPADLIELARWMSGYYCCPLGMVFATLLPAAVKRGTGMVMQQMVALADNHPTDVKLTKLQRAALDAAIALRDQGTQWVEIKRLADIAGARSVSPVKQLIDKQLLTTVQMSAVQSRGQAWDGDGELPPAHAFDLTASQARAVERLASTVGDGFMVHLLHGVTGSGKTEVYLRVIEHVLAADEQAGAIVLVPEIALTPQTVARFVGRFDSVAVLHSGLTAAQRHDHWRRIADGKARIVVGARSAVFAPLPKVGVIIVDEEQESSYKQDQLPRYNARDVAVRRGQLLNIPVVLGSATPSLESYHNATVRGAYHLLTLPERVMSLRMPKVELVDMIEERRHRRGVHLLSQRLENALRQTLADKGQAMLLLNRRGYANYIACPDHHCGWMMNCDYCDATMVYHKDKQLPTGGNVRCHHCGAEQLLPAQCPQSGHKVTVFGLGTQRVEEELHRKFAGLRFLRMDSDVMRTGRDYHHSLDQFRRGEVDVLVGTQMIAKGLDFPNVRLVGVISADTAINMPDFRATERTFQLVAQVAGRAGRSGDRGLVIVQTFSPDAPAIRFAAEHDFEGFAKAELVEREQADLPPFSRMARIVVRDKDQTACFEQAQKLYRTLERAVAQQQRRIRLRGPMPCPIARVASYYRMQIEIISPAPAAAAGLQQLLAALRNARALVSDARTAVDVDPVDLL
jgi:primosomal protein N' (replication factor Y)